MLEALSILPEKQGRSQAAPLAAGVSQGELGAASVRYHSFHAECLGLLTSLEQEQEDRTAPLIRRPRGKKSNK